MADTSTGYIRLFRSIREWDWYTDTNTKAVWLHCLLSANYKPKNWRGLTIQPGSFVSSNRQIAAETDISRKAVDRAIRNLKSTGELTTERVGKGATAGTLYRLTNWAFFNGEEPQESHKGATEGAIRIKKEGKKERRTPKSPYEDLMPVYDPEPVQEPTDEEIAAFYERHKKG